MAYDITVPSPNTVSTPHRCGEYDQRANHDHNDCELKELSEVHSQRSERPKAPAQNRQRATMQTRQGVDATHSGKLFPVLEFLEEMEDRTA
jgi:hypothetical protein